MVADIIRQTLHAQLHLLQPQIPFANGKNIGHRGHHHDHEQNKKEGDFESQTECNFSGEQIHIIRADNVRAYAKFRGYLFKMRVCKYKRIIKKNKEFVARVEKALLFGLIIRGRTGEVLMEKFIWHR